MSDKRSVRFLMVAIAVVAALQLPPYLARAGFQLTNQVFQHYRRYGVSNDVGIPILIYYFVLWIVTSCAMLFVAYKIWRQGQMKGSTIFTYYALISVIWVALAGIPPLCIGTF